MIEQLASCMPVGPFVILILTFHQFPTSATFLKLMTLLTILILIPILLLSCSSKKKVTDPQSFPNSHQVPRSSAPLIQNHRKRPKSMTRTLEYTDAPRHKRRSSGSGRKSLKYQNSPLRRGSEAKSKRQLTPLEIEKLLVNAEKVDRNCQMINNDEPETSNAGLTEMVIMKLREKQKIAEAKKLEELTTARSLEVPELVIKSKEKFQDLKLCSKTQVYNESDIHDIRQI